jgi:hypothetical protein
MFLFAVADSTVEEANVYVFVRQCLNIFVFYVHGYRPENNVGNLYYVKYFLVYV